MDLSEGITWFGNILHFGDILNMDGPLDEIGPRSVFANWVVGRWQWPAGKSPGTPKPRWWGMRRRNSGQWHENSGHWSVNPHGGSWR